MRPACPSTPAQSHCRTARCLFARSVSRIAFLRRASPAASARHRPASTGRRAHAPHSLSGAVAPLDHTLIFRGPARGAQDGRGRTRTARTRAAALHTRGGAPADDGASAVTLALRSLRKSAVRPDRRADGGRPALWLRAARENHTYRTTRCPSHAHARAPMGGEGTGARGVCTVRRSRCRALRPRFSSPSIRFTGLHVAQDLPCTPLAGHIMTSSAAPHLRYYSRPCPSI